VGCDQIQTEERSLCMFSAMKTNESNHCVICIFRTKFSVRFSIQQCYDRTNGVKEMNRRNAERELISRSITTGSER